MNNIKLVITTKISNKEELQDWHQRFILDGYEGSIIRWGNEGYKVNGRSSNLLKYKEFFDIDLPIIDITPNEVSTKQGTVWVMYKGNKVKCGVKMSHADREDLLTNKKDYIGRIANIRYFEETDGKSLRFPIFIGIHNDR